VMTCWLLDWLDAKPTSSWQLIDFILLALFVANETTVFLKCKSMNPHWTSAIQHHPACTRLLFLMRTSSSSVTLGGNVWEREGTCHFRKVPLNFTD